MDTMTDEIEILELPDGRFTWIVHSGGDLVFASPDFHSNPDDAEKEARAYAEKNYRGVAFVTVRRHQVAR